MTLHTYTTDSIPRKEWTTYTTYGFLELTGQDFNGQGHTPAMSKVISWLYHDAPHLHHLSLALKNKLSMPYNFVELATQNFNDQDHTTSMVKVKSRSHTDVTQPQFLTNFPAWHKLPRPYGFQDTINTQYLKIKVTTAMSKVKTRSHPDVVHQLSTPLNQYMYQV